MFFFNKNENKQQLLSPYEKERKIEQVIAMFPLLSRDHFLYSTLERCNWSLDLALTSLQRRHEYLESEQRQIERRIEEQRVKNEMKQRERERELRLVSQVRDVFGSRFSDHQISRQLISNGWNLESTINHFMREIEDIEYRERLRRQQRLDEEYRIQRQRERDEYEREERNKKRVNDLLLEIKYASDEKKRELANTKLFQDVLKDFGKLMEPEIKPLYIPIPLPQTHSSSSSSSSPSNNPFAQNSQHLFNNYQPSNVTPSFAFSPMTTTTSSSPPPPPPYGSNINNNNNNGSPFKTLDPFLPSPSSSSNTTTTTTASVSNEELLKQLKAMFPDISDEIIRYVLSTESNVSLAIQNLLDISIKFEKSKQN